MEKTRRSLRDLIDMAPAEARVIRNGQTLIVPVDDIAEGEIVVIHSGGKIPVDGAIVSGRGLFNESAITGESVPVSKAVGGTVHTGTILDTGFLQVRADHVGDDTTFAQIIELIEEARRPRPGPSGSWTVSRTSIPRPSLSFRCWCWPLPGTSNSR